MATHHVIVQGPGLTPTHTEQLAALTQAQGVISLGLGAARLMDIKPSHELRTECQEWAKHNNVDVALVPAGIALSHCKILAMDMDSTLINIECIDEIAAHVGRKADVSAITEAAMRGEISDFSESLRRRVALLKGVPVSALEAVYTEKLRLNPGAERLLEAAHHAGLKTLLVSGGFTFFTERLQGRLGLSYAYANTLEVSDSMLTGHVLGDIVDAQAKRRHLEALAQQYNATPSQIIALGDGANDLAMLGFAGYGVAYRAKPIVQAQAQYALNYSGLDAVLNWFEAN